MKKQMNEEYMQHGVLLNFPLDKCGIALPNYSISGEINTINVWISLDIHFRRNFLIK